MSQRTLKGASTLLPLLALVALLVSGIAPSANAERELKAETQGEASRQQGRGRETTTVPVSRARLAEVLESEQGDGMATDAVSEAPLSASATLLPTPTVIPLAPSPSPIPVYVPPRVTPTPLTASGFCAETHGQVSIHSFYSESLHRQLRYRIYLPPCYEESGRFFPVLYMFHGLNYGDSQWDTIGLDELADAGISAGTMSPLIIVMPNIWGIDRYPDGGPGSVEEAVVEDLIPVVERNYCAWSDRQGRAIGGLSRGAFWALEIAFRHPDLFASVGGHSPAVFWDNAAPQYNPYYLVEDAPGLESLRIYLDLGEQDWLNRWVPQFLGQLDERGLEYTFSTAPGDHGYAYWRSQLAAYLDFYTAVWSVDWRELPDPLDCTANPTAPGCRNGLGSGRPCELSIP